MNVGGHILVAARISDEVDLWLGAALPDFAAMGRFHLQVPETRWRQGRDEPVRRGIALHHRTDEIFHQHPWFTERVRVLRRRLEARGLARGPARAIAHVGPEMLLDGALSAWEHPATGATLAALDRHRPSLGQWTRLVDRHDEWSAHLTRLARHGLPDDYDQPSAVAGRLLRILGSRPRLGFEPGQLAIVVDELEADHPSLASDAHAFVDDIVEAVRKIGC
ncbi:MAG: hypothetical protein O3C27_11430 [Actinomycetota bacterium]|nr:hypothetical protein [Actinomycetota bacterium]